MVADRRVVLLLALGTLVFGTAGSAAFAQALAQIDAYDLVWRSPSRDASGSMPIGNGEVGCNVWVEPGGRLRFYVSRTDSFSEASRLLKLGLVEVSVRRPLADEPFEQRLCLREGCIRVTWGEGERRITLKLFVDAEADVVHVTGESARPEPVVVSASTWRMEQKRLAGDELRSSWTMQDAPADIAVEESADQAVRWSGSAAPEQLGFYHRNETSVVPLTLRHQGLAAAADQVRDPLLGRTFGLLLGGPELGAGHMRDARAPVLIGPARRSFALHVAAPCVQDEDAGAWQEGAAELLAAADSEAAAMRTAAWWRAFWARSWILVSGDAVGGFAVPANAHPLRIGVDSAGGNRFVGTISGVRVYAGPAAEPDRLRYVADPQRELPQVAGEPGALVLPGGFRIEATIEQDPGHPIGRIVDSITAGRGDGVLFDTHPGSALRLIVGDRQLCAEGALTPGKRHEVAASYDAATGRMALLRDGELVAESAGDTSADPPPPSRLSEALVLQRWVQACGGRGAYPIKFNGSIFTVEPRLTGGQPFDADWRRWGDCFWWQNTRLPYHPMLAQGDFEMMEPLFRMYQDAVPLARARARIYHRVEGAYFPETMTLFGTYANRDYGWDREGHRPDEVLCRWWRYAWNQGPELLDLMLDRYDYAPDAAFARERLLPMADAVLAYFRSRFLREDDGRLHITPTQSLESYWDGVEDDLPAVAGLWDVLDRLLLLPDEVLGRERRAAFSALRDALPPIPVREVDGVRVLAPAAKYEPKRHNIENPELYAVFPFRRYGLGRPDLAVGRETYRRRHEKRTDGWTQDGQQAALLGLCDEARENLEAKVRNSNPKHRFPAMWGPNFDWLPDQCHGGNLLSTAELMLLQAVGRKLHVLPCWPADWDVSFRLCAPGRTVVEVDYRGGEIVRLDVTPPERRRDVVLPGK